MYSNYCILLELNFTRNCVVLIIRFQSPGEKEATTLYCSIGTIFSTLSEFKNVFCVLLLCVKLDSKKRALLYSTQRGGDISSNTYILTAI